MNAVAGSLGQATYVASKDDCLWLLNVQRKLHARSREPSLRVNIYGEPGCVSPA
jgi:hypothetical protein